MFIKLTQQPVKTLNINDIPVIVFNAYNLHYKNQQTISPMIYKIFYNSEIMYVYESVGIVSNIYYKILYKIKYYHIDHISLAVGDLKGNRIPGYFHCSHDVSKHIDVEERLTF